MASSSLSLCLLALAALMALASAGCVVKGKSTFNVKHLLNSGYMVDGCLNPTFKLEVGVTYKWVIDAPNHPFWIKTTYGTGNSNALIGVINNGVGDGTVEYTTTLFNKGKTYYYNCENHDSMRGEIIVDSANSLSVASVLLITLLALVFVF